MGKLLNTRQAGETAAYKIKGGLVINETPLIKARYEVQNGTFEITARYLGRGLFEMMISAEDIKPGILPEGVPQKISDAIPRGEISLSDLNTALSAIEKIVEKI